MIILIRYILNPIKVKIKPLTFYHNLIKISNKKWKKKKKNRKKCKSSHALSPTVDNARYYDSNKGALSWELKN